VSDTDKDSTVIRKPRSRAKRLAVLQFAVLAAASATLGLLWYKLAEERTAMKAAVQFAAGVSERLARAEANAAELRTRLTAAETEAASARARADELTSEVQEKDSGAQRLRGAHAALKEKLNPEIKKGEIHLTRIGGRIRVDLLDRILFDPGKADLTAGGKDVLSRVGAILLELDDRQIQVSGHTDDPPIAQPLLGAFGTTWELSAARAVNVVLYLQEKAKVPGKRLVAAGYGHFQPIANNGGAAGRARNRRIEILLTPSLEGRPLQALSAPTPTAPGSTEANLAKTGKPIAKRPAKRK
jgi:chemotaxis protein MotB